MNITSTSLVRLPAIKETDPRAGGDTVMRRRYSHEETQSPGGDSHEGRRHSHEQEETQS